MTVLCGSDFSFRIGSLEKSILQSALLLEEDLKALGDMHGNEKYDISGNDSDRNLDVIS
ncbi:unnamed protein product [Dovyalis caffra]|uniref:Uncharacterized protein n=1 Tax=Dovyalis caffra TaxID=77055 RepID=A0AAV1RSU1_9ROSI|nr:unnamed protein product [Dovyalis caffra]